VTLASATFSADALGAAAVGSAPVGLPGIWAGAGVGASVLFASPFSGVAVSATSAESGAAVSFFTSPLGRVSVGAFACARASTEQKAIEEMTAQVSPIKRGAAVLVVMTSFCRRIAVRHTSLLGYTTRRRNWNRKSTPLRYMRYSSALRCNFSRHLYLHTISRTESADRIGKGLTNDCLLARLQHGNVPRSGVQR
jgi:hypothetical protein